MTKNQFEGSKILVVEDEESLALGLKFNLNEEGYIVLHAQNGQEALHVFDTQKFDLIILDLMLPFIDGFEVAKYIRKKDPQIPILILTARSGIKERIQGLELGADDYLNKPFHLDELLWRIHGMLKRKMWYKNSVTANPVYRFGQNEINFENLNCLANTKKIILTPLEAMVIKYLIENKNKIVSRQELLENVWRVSSEIETRTVDNFIVRLRRYFEPNPSKPKYIISVRGSGYRFSDE